jgi:hypothetical protein
MWNILGPDLAVPTAMTRSQWLYSEKEATIMADTNGITIADVLGGPGAMQTESLDPYEGLSQQEREKNEAENNADYIVENECSDKSLDEQRKIWHAARNTHLVLKSMGL